jgi:predicted Zn-dependent protease|tara:strand:+ start:3356 stop:4165 length:810 start_codon:yes stop_codon:yes gene_type:complete
VALKSERILPFRGIILFATGLITASGLVWFGAQLMTPESKTLGNREILNKQVKNLLNRQQNGSLNREGQQQLLERLLVLDRYEQASSMLELLIAREPKTWVWGLMLAELKRQQGDLDGALEQTNHLLSLHPQTLEVLQLKILLDLETGRGKAAVAELKKRFESKTKGERLAIGLLLADLQRQTGQVAAAASLYRFLANESANDARPLIALALMQQEQGNSQQAQALLREARARRRKPGEADPLIDGLAGQWGLDSIRTKGASAYLKAGS